LLARFRFSDEEVALAVSSHNGELRHVNLAKQMLDKIGLSVDALKCGAHAPYGRTLPADEPLCALHNNCSGKHASMLAACVANGWPLENYIEFDHPLQVAIRKTIRAAAHLEPDSELKHGIDGCGVPTYFMTLKEMATMWSNVGAEFPEQRRFFSWCEVISFSKSRFVSRCAAENSWCVAGEDEFDTILPIVTKGRIIAKRGGGALECLNVGSIGIVAKVADGDTKARDPMMMRALDILNLLSAEERTQLLPFATQKLFNVAGKQIGVIKPIF
jgi:L-asparaginase II